MEAIVYCLEKRRRGIFILVESIKEYLNKDTKEKRGQPPLGKREKNINLEF